LGTDAGSGNEGLHRLDGLVLLAQFASAEIQRLCRRGGTSHPPYGKNQEYYFRQFMQLQC
jgi:hypothetical protein